MGNVEVAKTPRRHFFILQDLFEIVPVDPPRQTVPIKIPDGARNPSDRIFKNSAKVDFRSAGLCLFGKLQFLKQVGERVGAGYLVALAVGSDELESTVASVGVRLWSILDGDSFVAVGVLFLN